MRVNPTRGPTARFVPGTFPGTFDTKQHSSVFLAPDWTGAAHRFRMKTHTLWRKFRPFLPMHAIRDFFQNSGVDFSSGRLFDLFFTAHHGPQLARHRLQAIHARIRLVAALFVVPTLAWIALDMLTLEVRHGLVLAGVRSAAALVFVGLALVPRTYANRTATLALLVALLAIPMVIYGVAVHLFAGQVLHGFALTNARLYAALPMVVMAGISIFPLVAVESLGIALALAAAVAAVQLLGGDSSVAELLSMLWVQMLVMAVYLVACAIQLHYMMALLREASHDKLTGALTRRSGADAMGVYYRLSCQQGTPFAVLFLDLDHFKAVNDNFGHDAGDKVLQSMVSHLQKHLRQADVVVRWGGEEFVVLLTNTSMQAALDVVNRMMLDGFGARPDGGPLTASMGLAERLTDGGTDWMHLVSLADQRMYLAKSRGRARCVSQSV